MPGYQELDSARLLSLLDELKTEYEEVRAKGLRLDMSRGKPGTDQLDLSDAMLANLKPGELSTEGGFECRNYGLLDGIPEAKRLMGEILGVSPETTFIGGNASLSLMHDCITFSFIHGLPGATPWCRQDTVKVLCPSPGYDRHFAMAEHFGFELVPVAMTAEGPDMDQVEALIRDSAVKAIWCVPKYSNPLGITFSDTVVRRMAALSPAAPDFRIYWDNAYAVHHLDTQNPDILLNLMEELERNGRQDMAFTFTSTSKITYAGGGISAAGMSKTNFDWFMAHKTVQTIGYDKVNQLRHARMFPDMGHVTAHMAKHAAILRPKFQTVLDMLEPLGRDGIASWNKPNGGYFISLDTLPGCAKRVGQLCKEAGVVLTTPGATFPYGKDPEDKNIRIAPTLPPISELEQAAALLCLCVRIASAEKILADRTGSSRPRAGAAH
ncbi:aminotransferase class I/II-fold pyridoxal phosphate-dependent enzyme [Ruminococcaceae bacterium OttesenSCG-928-L11]|nr:aminotransferase class I/II-fold pyridoxal phosphate-dependent enzyme [Ruminococcaceae bacterium OttesenSCG-928-L11]